MNWTKLVFRVTPSNIGWLRVWIPVVLTISSTSNVAAAAQVRQAWGVHQASAGVEALAPDGLGNLYVGAYSYSSTSAWDFVLTKYDSAGSQLWQRQYDGAGQEDFASAVVATSTNVIIAGSSRNANGDRDFLVLNYNAAGTLLWTARYNGPAGASDTLSALALDRDGSVFVAGNSVGARTGEDITVVKYAASGQLQWTFRYDGPGENTDSLAALRLDAQGNIYVAGTLADLFGRHGIVTLKLNPTGQQVWATRQVPANDPWELTASGLALDSNGNVITVASEDNDLLTLKYNPDGSLSWAARHHAEEPASLRAVNVRVDAENSIVTGGNLYGAGTNDVVLVKYDAKGRQLWASRIPHPVGSYHAYDMDMDADGNTYVTGAPHNDVFTVKVGANGNQIWSTDYNSSESYFDLGEVVKADGSNVFIAGRSIYFGQTFVSVVKYEQLHPAGPPIVSVSPTAQVVSAGTNVTFTATASGTGPFSYQWRFTGRPIAGATGSSLTIDNVRDVHRGDYSVVVSNPVALTVSAEARLTVLAKPVVTIDPPSQVSFPGGQAGFTVQFPFSDSFGYPQRGTEPLSFQWRRNNVNLPGATNMALRLSNVSPADAGQYSVIVSNPAGLVEGGVATLTISNDLRQIGAITYNGAPNGSEAEPLLRLSPSQEKIMAAVSESFDTGRDILVVKYGPDDQLLWTARFNRSAAEPDEPSALAVDAAGNIYVVGASGHPYESQQFLTTLKYSPDGQLRWARHYREDPSYEARATSVAVDSAGHVTVAGFTGRPVLLRYDADGTQRWIGSGPESAYERTQGVALDQAGNSYLGSVSGTGDAAEFALRKFDGTGGIVWTRTFDAGFAEHFTAIVSDADGNLVMLGSSVQESGHDVVVMKYAPDGGRLWATNLDLAPIEYLNLFPRALVLGDSGSISVVSSVEDGDDDQLGTAIFRLAADGRREWTVMEPTFEVSDSTQPAVDARENVYVTGRSGRPASGDDVTTIKIGAEGVRLWTVSYGSEGAWNDWGTSVVVERGGDVVVAGSATARTGEGTDLVLVRYRPSDFASEFRLGLQRRANGSFQFEFPAGEFTVEGSDDLRQWAPVSPGELQALEQLTIPGAPPFPQRFYRLRRP